MVYTGNTLSITGATIEGNWNEAVYITSDTLASVLAANYISDGQKRGLELGDIIWVIANNVTYLTQVTALQATSAGYGVTLTQIGSGTGTGAPGINTAVTTVGAATLTGAAIAGGNITRSGSTAAFTDTTDTAANIIAAMNSQQIGNSWHLIIVNTTAFTETLAGGTGVTLSGNTVVPANSWGEFLVTYSAANTVTMVGLEAGPNVSLPASQYSTAALQSATMTAAQVSGADWVNFDNTGTTPGNLQFPTAAAVIANIPNAQVGFNYMLAIRNDSGSANTATITTNTGVTLTGTMTIAQNVTRLFNVSITAAGAITVQSMGVLAAAA